MKKPEQSSRNARAAAKLKRQAQIRNLWITNIAKITRTTELKQARRNTVETTLQDEKKVAKGPGESLLAVPKPLQKLKDTLKFAIYG